MRRLIFLMLCFILFLPAFGQNEGIRFFPGSWEEAIKLAKKENKQVFVDLFTEWCGPCLNMAMKVFPRHDVGKVYNKHFICLKIDAEKGKGLELIRKYDVRYFPTYLFIDPQTEKVVHRSGNFKSAEDFIADAAGALDPHLSCFYMDEKYSRGKYDLEFLCDYIHMKKVRGDTGALEELFERILDKGGKLTDRRIWNLYCECLGGYKNRYLKEISDNYELYVQLYSKKEVDRKLAEATRYAPKTLLDSLCDFEGKYFNQKMIALLSLFRDRQYDQAWLLVDSLLVDTAIDQKSFLNRLAFYTRVEPDFQDRNLTFEQLVKKIRYTRYVAYNAYDRDEAMNHYHYAVALEYLIRRSLEEGRQIPSDLLAAPQHGKTVYDMRHPLLKKKPSYRRASGKRR